MHYARIIQNVAVDVVTDDPSVLFHPEIAQLFELVPNEVAVGWRLVEGEWIEGEPEVPPAAQKVPIQLAIIDFLRMFKQAELIAFNALRKQVEALTPQDYTDPDKSLLVGFEVGLTHYDALRTGLIELDHPDTVQWLSLLVPLGVLSSERLAQVLAGQAPA